MRRLPNLGEETMSSRAIAFVDKVMPSAPPILEMNIFSILKWGEIRSLAHEVHTRANNPTKPTPAIRFLGLGDDVSTFTPHKEFKDNRRVRPANFEKWVKKFNGLGDPYNHMASFKQIARVEQVYDLHTKIEGLGLTLKGRALSWFQTLTLFDYLTYKKLEKDFIASFSKIGLKHDVLSQIHGFNQKRYKLVKDKATRLRCPSQEMPSQ